MSEDSYSILTCHSSVQHHGYGGPGQLNRVTPQPSYLTPGAFPKPKSFSALVAGLPTSVDTQFVVEVFLFVELSISCGS